MWQRLDGNSYSGSRVRARMSKSVCGFTLIELLVTLAVAAIVLSVAVPSFQSQILNNRSVSLGEDMASAINLARSEAVKRATRVAICASKSGTDCDGEWTDGFIVFIDSATKDTDPVPVVGTILKVWDGLDVRAVITAKSDTDDVTFIRYTGLGTLARVKEKQIVVTAQMKKCTLKAARKITVGLSGMVSIENATCTAS